MTTQTPPPADLMALSEKATPGEWFIGRMLNPSNAPALIGDGDSVLAIFPAEWNHCTYQKSDADFIAALVNWFRETHQPIHKTVVPDYVSPMKAIADDLRNETFVGIGPPLTGPELWLETHKGKKG